MCRWEQMHWIIQYFDTKIGLNEWNNNNRSFFDNYLSYISDEQIDTLLPVKHFVLKGETLSLCIFGVYVCSTKSKWALFDFMQIFITYLYTVVYNGNNNISNISIIMFALKTFESLSETFVVNKILVNNKTLRNTI